MSSARLEKLKSLLARVEHRRAQPRLRAVPSATSVTSTSPAAFDEDEESIDTEPPPALLLTEKKPAAAKAPASPIEDALAKLDQSGPLDVQALAEPIAMKPPQVSERPAAEAPKSDTRPELQPVARAPETLSRARMSQPDPSMLDDEAPVLPPVELKPARAPSSVREPTLRFDTGVEAAPQAQVEIGGLPSKPVPASLLDAPPVAPAAPAPAAPANAPSQVLEAPALDAAAVPARTVSAARVEAPKSFGELLEQSLALRPR